MTDGFATVVGSAALVLVIILTLNLGGRCGGLREREKEYIQEIACERAICPTVTP